MTMTRARAIEVMIGRHREALARSEVFRCACCESVLKKEEASHVQAYEPVDPVMKQVVPVENIATYVVCKECARMPEETVRVQVEQYLVKNGLLSKDLKPLTQKGGHSPEHQRKHKHDNKLFPGRN